MVKRTLTGTVTKLVATRAVKLNGVTVAAGTEFFRDSPRLAGARIDSLLSKGILRVKDGLLPLRSNRATRPFHVNPRDYRNWPDAP